MPTNSKESEIRLASWILNDFRSHRSPRSSHSLDTNYKPLQNGLRILPTPGVFSALSTFCFFLQPSSRMTEETGAGQRGDWAIRVVRPGCQKPSFKDQHPLSPPA